MRCDTARRAIFDLAAGQPPDAELAAHLAECAVCAEEYAADWSVHMALRNAPWPRTGLAPEWQPSRRVGAPSGPVQGLAERMLPRSAEQRRVASIALVGAMLAVLVIGLGAVVVRTRTDLAVGGRDALAGAGGTSAPGGGGSGCGLLARLLGDRACRASASDGSYWTRLAPLGDPPTPRGAGASQAFGYDEVDNRLVMFGGMATDGSLLDDTWVLVGADGTEDAAHWVRLQTANTPPPQRHHAAAYDAADNRLITYGGCLGGCFPIDDRVQVLSNADGLGGAPVWTALETHGASPPARVAHTASYDPASNRLIAFGGDDGLGHRMNDVWVLTDADGLGGAPTWIRLETAGESPPPRAGHTAIYDGAGNRLIVFGGTVRGAETTDIWVLERANGLGGPPAWEQVRTDRTPPFGAAVYDAGGDRLLVFGGEGVSGFASDVWVLDGFDGLGGTPAWSRRAPEVTAPSPRSGAMVAYRSSTDVLIVVGGDDADGRFNDVWTFHPGPGSRSAGAAPR